MLTHSRNAAWWQGCCAIAASLVVAAAVVFCMKRPFDRETLAIQAGQLHSQAAEMALADRLLASGRLAPGFARVHAGQLRRKTVAVAGQLGAHAAGPGLQRPLRDAREGAAALDQVFRQRRRVVGDPGRGVAFDTLAQRMGKLKSSLDPEG